MTGKIDLGCLESILEYAEKVAHMKEERHNCFMHDRSASCENYDRLTDESIKMRSDIMHRCRVK